MSGPKKTSDRVLVILGVFLLAFEVCMVVLFCLFQAVPDTLIQYTLGAGGVEALVLAVIKVSKVVTGDKTVQDAPGKGAEREGIV